MNRREKILAGAIGGIVGVLVIGLGIRSVIVKPVKEIDKRTEALRDKLSKVKAERRAYFDAEDRMKDYTRRTFADSVDQASARSGEILTKLILQSGLAEDQFTRLPYGPNPLRGAQEIGWSVQGEGPLSDVVDLLFLLQESPWLHRLENFSVTPGESPGVVRVRFRYLSLVMAPAPEIERKDLVARYTLESVERQLYAGIVSRDILRPYVKRIPPPAPPPSGTKKPGSNGSSTQPAQGPGPENFRIVSLSEWRGQPEIHVRDLAQQKTRLYKTGDPLAGGTVVCVDYRSLPQPGNELLRSDSRVIIKIGSDFFAIERGETLAQTRKLSSSQLPAGLSQAQ